MSTNERAGFVSGVFLMVLFACTATYIAGFEWVKQLRISPLIVGIVIGMAYANTLRRHVPSEWGPGITFCSKQVLRFGIVLYGFQVTLGDVLAVGLPALVVDVLVVTLTLVFGVLLGKLLKMDSQTAMLTSVGSSICGAAAVLAAEPVVKGEPYKAAVAVSTVVIFGTLSMFLYPACYRADVYDMDARQMGIYTGATLHEVAHVYGAGEAMNGTDELHDSAYERMRAVQTEMNEAVEQYRLQYPEAAAELKAAQQRICTDCEALVATMRGSEESGGQKVDIKQPAVIVKMLRVILLAPVLIVLSFILSRRAQQTDGKARVQVPAFAVFFLLVIGFNSLNLLPVSCVSAIRSVDTFLLTMAMTALGVETSFDKFRKAGPKPFLLALMLFAWLVFGGYWLVKGVTAIW